MNFLIALLIPLSVYAGREGNGGDDAAAEAHSVVQSVLQWVGQQSSEIPAFRKPSCQRLLKGAKIKILITDEPVLVESDGETYEVVAKNLKKPDRILVNRGRWMAITSDVLKMGLMVHEVMGLAGLERTGSYTYTNLFFKQFGISCENGECLRVVERRRGQIERMRSHLVNNGPWSQSLVQEGITVVHTLEFRADNMVVVSAVCKWSEKGREDVFVRMDAKINYLENQIQYLEANTKKQKSSFGDFCYVYTKQVVDPVVIVSDSKIVIGGVPFGS